MPWGIRPRGCRAPRYCEDGKFTIRMNHWGSKCDNLYVNGTLDFIDFYDNDQMSMFEIDLMVKELGPLLSYKTKSNVEQPTKYPEPHKVKIVEQEAVEDVEDFLEPEAPKNAKKGKGKTVVEAPTKGKATMSSKDKEVAEPEAPKRIRATRSLKGKEVAEPETPKRARFTRSSKGKGVAMASATEGEDSDASLSNASSFVDSEYGRDNVEEIAEETNFLQQWITDHATVEDTFQPIQDEEINEGECGAVNEEGVVNEGEGPSGDHPSHAGLSGDHHSQTSQNEDQPSQTGQNKEQPSRTTNFHHTDLQDTRLEEGDQAVEDELKKTVWCI
ncbi:hypothetical protein L3X38_000706 [Prunus dulcis]|uniref:Uncharacterized protein n=1 Tax=Prunus dulcis TaxID=3755 RepID=A0AAD4WQT7_PRUDU|nr:hypothetical protein L3X38_000706 [Prunus dulcis]